MLCAWFVAGFTIAGSISPRINLAGHPSASTAFVVCPFCLSLRCLSPHQQPPYASLRRSVLVSFSLVVCCIGFTCSSLLHPLPLLHCGLPSVCWPVVANIWFVVVDRVCSAELDHGDRCESQLILYCLRRLVRTLLSMFFSRPLCLCRSQMGRPV